MKYSKILDFVNNEKVSISFEKISMLIVVQAPSNKKRVILDNLEFYNPQSTPLQADTRLFNLQKI